MLQEKKSRDGSKTYNISCLMPIDKKAGLSTSFSAKDVVPAVSLSAKKLKLTVNDSGSKENEIRLI